MSQRIPPKILGAAERVGCRVLASRQAGVTNPPASERVSEWGVSPIEAAADRRSPSLGRLAEWLCTTRPTRLRHWYETGPSIDQFIQT